MVRKLILWVIALAVVLCCCSCGFGAGRGSSEIVPAKPIPNWLLYPWEFLRVLWDSLFTLQDTAAPEC